MCLQYAIWALASNGHAKYDQYSQIFYQRARQYADADEMKVGCRRPNPMVYVKLNQCVGPRRALHHHRPRSDLGTRRCLRSQVHVLHTSLHQLC